MKLSQSSAKTYRRCTLQFKYKYLDGLEARLQAPRLKIGNWAHTLLPELHTTGNWQAEHKRLTKQFNNLLLQEREYYGDLPTLVEGLMKAYEYRWREENAEWEVIFAEEDFEIEYRGHTISFTPDLIVQTKNGIWVVDHKTTKSIPTSEYRLFDLQSTLYPWALKKAGLEVNGFIFNYIRQKSPTIPKINKDGSVSRARVDTTYYTLARFLKDHYGSMKAIPDNWRAQLQALKIGDKYFKRSRIVKNPKLTKNQVQELMTTASDMEEFFAKVAQGKKPYVRNMLMACDWDCDFQEICQAELFGIDTTRLKKAKYKASDYVKRKHGNK